MPRTRSVQARLTHSLHGAEPGAVRVRGIIGRSGDRIEGAAARNLAARAERVLPESVARRRPVARGFPGVVPMARDPFGMSVRRPSRTFRGPLVKAHSGATRGGCSRAYASRRAARARLFTRGAGPQVTGARAGNRRRFKRSGEVASRLTLAHPGLPADATLVRAWVESLDEWC